MNRERRSLPLTNNREEVKQNILEFNAVSNENEEDYKRRLIRRCIYFVFDSDNSLFAPCKFAAFRDMTIERYRECPGNDQLDGFDGHITRIYVENEIGSVRDTESLITQFSQWLCRWGIDYNKDPVIFRL